MKKEKIIYRRATAKWYNDTIKKFEENLKAFDPINFPRSNMVLNKKLTALKIKRDQHLSYKAKPKSKQASRKTPVSP